MIALRRIPLFFLLLASLFVLTGMGGGTGAPAGSIPEVDEDIAARLTDRSGFTVELSNFSMEGNLFLSGMQGRGDVTIFFKEIAKISFNNPVGEEIPADIVLKDGKKLRLEVRKRALFYGNTGYGAYQVKARELSNIEFP